MKNFQTLYDAGSVIRFHTRRTIQQTTVGHHTFGVMLILLQITAPSANLLAAAAFHDLPEGITGDTPYPAKRAHPILKMALESVEHDFEIDHQIMVNLNDDERHLLHWADMMELMMFVVSELRMGNRRMRDVYANAYQALVALGHPTIAAEELFMEVTYVT